jgi:predicted ATP-grasp superfamily ATP-dependent carboligase
VSGGLPGMGPSFPSEGDTRAHTGNPPGRRRHQGVLVEQSRAGVREVTRPRALVVEQGWSRGCLAAVRALSAAGWSVGVAAPEPRGLALASRCCRFGHLIAPLQPSVDAFVTSVATVARQGRYDVVFGAGEAEVLALSAARTALPAVFPHSQHDLLLRALDKSELSRAACAVGLAVPDVVDVGDVPDERTAVVVKARLHARPDVQGAPPRIDTTVVVGRTAAHRRVADIRALGGEPEVQTFHAGTLVAYSAVRGRAGQGVVADSMQRASRIWPPGAGASCRAETVEADEDLVDRSGALLEELGWFGLAELQFLVGEDGVPRLIDLNGRFYGSLSLAVAAGANLPAAWADLALGRTPGPRVRARPGVRYQWGTADVRRALRERRGGLLADVAATTTYAARSRHSVVALRDPAPAATRLLGAAAARLGSGTGGR